MLWAIRSDLLCKQQIAAKLSGKEEFSDEK